MKCNEMQNYNEKKHTNDKINWNWSLIILRYPLTSINASSTAITSATVIGSDSGALLCRPTSIALFTSHNTLTIRNSQICSFNEFNNLTIYKFNNQQKCIGEIKFENLIKVIFTCPLYITLYHFVSYTVCKNRTTEVKFENLFKE